MRVTIRTLGLFTFLVGILLSGHTVSIPVGIWSLMVFLAIAFSLASLELDNNGSRSIYLFSWILALMTLVSTIGVTVFL